MEFMNEYKRLDNLCKDVFRSDAGVSRYIEAMNSYWNNEYSVNGWTSDLNNLKRYRHIRNRIVHENDIKAADLCDENDAMWIAEFYDRIIEIDDPLARIRQSPGYSANKKAGSNDSYAASTSRQNTYFGDTVGNDKQSDKTWDTVGIVIIALLTSVLVGLLFALCFILSQDGYIDLKILQ